MNLQPLLDLRESVVMKDEDKAELLNAFFASVSVSKVSCSQATQPLLLED